jgi:uncharacterized protein (TIGR02246 family)
VRQKRSAFLITAAAFAVSFLAACSTQPAAPAAPPDTRAADEAAIRAADIEWAKAAEAKDLEKCMSIYQDDAVVFAPPLPALNGKDKIGPFIQGITTTPGLQLAVHIANVDVARSGDIAIDTGTVDATMTDKKGKPVTSTSQYVLVWKKQSDGSWKIAADTSAATK